MKYAGWEPNNKVCMVSAYTPQDKWNELGNMTSITKMRYCEKWGYSLRIYTDGFDPSRPISWSKILFLKEILKTHEWVFWIDADAAITNYDVPLEPILEASEELVITNDFLTTLNFGVFFLRRSDFANWFLDEIWGKTEYMHHGVWEQAAVWELWTKGLLAGHTKIEPARRFNSFYHTEDNFCGMKEDSSKNPEVYHWALGDFVVHFAGRAVEKKIEGFLRVQELVDGH